MVNVLRQWIRNGVAGGRAGSVLAASTGTLRALNEVPAGSAASADARLLQGKGITTFWENGRSPNPDFSGQNFTLEQFISDETVLLDGVIVVCTALVALLQTWTYRAEVAEEERKQEEARAGAKAESETFTMALGHQADPRLSEYDDAYQKFHRVEIEDADHYRSVIYVETWWCWKHFNAEFAVAACFGLILDVLSGGHTGRCES
jgi:hypothetical protein